MRSETELTAIYRRHCKTVWNLCCTLLRHPQDAEDAMQEVFLRTGLSGKVFRDAEHEKAWLITVTKNVCRDELKKAHRREVSLEDVNTDAPSSPQETSGVLAAVRSLPEHYRIAIYLYYYEGYPSAQIAKLTGKPDATIRTYLRRGRTLLKKQLEEDQ